MRATPGANLLVTLEEDSQALEEVVVVGTACVQELR